MADGAAAVEEGLGPAGPRGPAPSPLVAVSFQKNVHRKEKFLEAEPKALGITQIGMSLFQITCVAVFLSQGLSEKWTDVPFFIASLLLTIAGSVAVAAGNLHLPTLRACLGMQIVACVASVFNLICSLVKMEISPYDCWNYYYEFNATHIEKPCHGIENTHTHLFAEVLVIQVALLAISVTLAAYCCKVVHCCSPAPKMPVITVHAAPVQ
ncbi:membrane-spanning 4-domains subfamily A member 4D-like [Pseudoliparis swirei]|uniref:membrane-spanning 4-domains subfamily A member 4D-like n=1 Tax=Pseudoliparis swirei TaxID=2059687 RepID=UPI0024BDDFEB|nr:membrane-spanning 4-domains subfamily A member 4D-like [Pseudoliparis swirei]XP_056298163.1 membrane-spanning 4-domains subfamily A member 4D-like [Pseudoliparis swirei]